VSVQIRLVVSCGFRCDNLDGFFKYILLSHYRKDSIKLSCEQPRVDYFDKQITSYHPVKNGRLGEGRGSEFGKFMKFQIRLENSTAINVFEKLLCAYTAIQPMFS